MKNQLKNYFLIVILGSILFFPFLGNVHLFDWDEINFAEIVREMIVLKDYWRVHINFEPFWEKPPLFIWMQVLSMKVFGLNEYAARFPNAVCGIVTLLTLFYFGKKIKDDTFGWLWIMCYVGSLLPHFYFKSGIIDPWFNLFIFMGLSHFIVFTWKQKGEKLINFRCSKHYYLFASGFFINLAVLSKGPVAFLIFALVVGVYWLLKKGVPILSFLQIIIITVIAFTGFIIWYGVEVLQNGTTLLVDFIAYQYRLLSTPDAGHAGFPGFHIVVLLLGCFPASIFAIKGFSLKSENTFLQAYKSWIVILFFVVLILFSIVQSKIVHYSSLCYFPITFLAAFTIHELLMKKVNWSRWMTVMLLFIGFIWGFVAIAIPFIGRNINWLVPLLKNDAFALANIEADINWMGWESITGIIFLIALFVAIAKLITHQTKTGIITLFSGSIALVILLLLFYVKNIEGYSQRAAIDFFKSLQDQDCYVETYKYKSYAHLFYTKKRAPEKKYRLGWLMNGNIDKDVYLVSRINHAEEVLKHKNFNEIGRKNGFVFFKRTKQANTILN